MQTSEEVGWAGYAKRDRRRYSPLLSPEKKPSPVWSFSAVSWRVVAVSLLLVAIAGVVMLSVLGPQGRTDMSSHPASWNELQPEGPPDLPMMTVRVYPAYNDEPPELYPWEHVAEPYRTAVMEVNTSRPSEVRRDDVDFR